MALQSRPWTRSKDPRRSLPTFGEQPLACSRLLPYVETRRAIGLGLSCWKDIGLQALSDPLYDLGMQGTLPGCATSFIRPTTCATFGPKDPFQSYSKRFLAAMQTPRQLRDSQFELQTTTSGTAPVLNDGFLHHCARAFAWHHGPHLSASAGEIQMASPELCSTDAVGVDIPQETVATTANKDRLAKTNAPRCWKTLPGLCVQNAKK